MLHVFYVLFIKIFHVLFSRQKKKQEMTQGENLIFRAYYFGVIVLKD